MTIPAPDWQDQLRMQHHEYEKMRKKWEEMMRKPLRPHKYGWEEKWLPPEEKQKPAPKLVEVNLTTDQLRELLENPDKGVLVHLDGYEVLIREV